MGIGALVNGDHILWVIIYGSHDKGDLSCSRRTTIMEEKRIAVFLMRKDTSTFGKLSHMLDIIHLYWSYWVHKLGVMDQSNNRLKSFTRFRLFWRR